MRGGGTKENAAALVHWPAHHLFGAAEGATEGLCLASDARPTTLCVCSLPTLARAGLNGSPRTSSRQGEAALKRKPQPLCTAPTRHLFGAAEGATEGRGCQWRAKKGLPAPPRRRAQPLEVSARVAQIARQKRPSQKRPRARLPRQRPGHRPPGAQAGGRGRAGRPEAGRGHRRSAARSGAACAGATSAHQLPVCRCF